MSRRPGAARFSATDALKRILEEGDDTDSSLLSERNSDSEYEDHLSQHSDASDVEVANIASSASSQQHLGVQRISDVSAPASRGRVPARGRCRDRGRGRGSNDGCADGGTVLIRPLGKKRISMELVVDESNTSLEPHLV